MERNGVVVEELDVVGHLLTRWKSADGTFDSAVQLHISADERIDFDFFPAPVHAVVANGKRVV